jgi:elongator complex protein 2
MKLYTVAASSSRKLVATVCKASSAEHAVVRIYDSETWRPFGEPLQGHELTITRIAFSPDDRYILTVSRDRTFCLFELSGGKAKILVEYIVTDDRLLDGYQRISREVAHARIIWDCDWAPDSSAFATASRDKTVRNNSA